jgi:hypothetical protein
LQPGRINPLFGQELRAALNGFENRHADKATRCGRRSKHKTCVGALETAASPPDPLAERESRSLIQQRRRGNAHFRTTA